MNANLSRTAAESLQLAEIRLRAYEAMCRLRPGENHNHHLIIAERYLAEAHLASRDTGKDERNQLC